MLVLALADTDLITLASIVVPVVITIAITIVVLRGAKNDPDEQRFRRLADERRRQVERERRSGADERR